MSTAIRLWIALVEISPLPGNRMIMAEAAGGYVNAVAYAKDEKELCDKIRRSLVEYHVELKTIESMAAIEGAPEEQEFEPAIMEVLGALSPNEDAQFGTVFCFPTD